MLTFLNSYQIKAQIFKVPFAVQWYLSRLENHGAVWQCTCEFISNPYLAWHWLNLLTVFCTESVTRLVLDNLTYLITVWLTSMFTWCFNFNQWNIINLSFTNAYGYCNFRIYRCERKFQNKSMFQLQISWSSFLAVIGPTKSRKSEPLNVSKTQDQEIRTNVVVRTGTYFKIKKCHGPWYKL